MSNLRSEEEIKEIGEIHWKYVESICHKMYIDAFIHGWKHGVENEQSR